MAVANKVARRTTALDRFIERNPAAQAYFPDVKEVSATERDEVLSNTKQGLYVLNNNYGRIGDREEKMILAINAKDHGEDITIPVPATWVPINLLDRASRQAILSSQHFRQALSRRALLLLRPEDAIKVLEHEDAQIEFEVAMRSIQINQQDLDMFDEQKESKKTERQVERTAEEIEFENCHPQVFDLCSRDGISPQEVRAFLLTQKTNLKMADINYLSKYLPEDVKKSAIVQGQLGDIRGNLEQMNNPE